MGLSDEQILFQLPDHLRKDVLTAGNAPVIDMLRRVIEMHHEITAADEFEHFSQVLARLVQPAVYPTGTVIFSEPLHPYQSMVWGGRQHATQLHAHQGYLYFIMHGEVDVDVAVESQENNAGKDQSKAKSALMRALSTVTAFLPQRKPKFKFSAADDESNTAVSTGKSRVASENVARLSTKPDICDSKAPPTADSSLSRSNELAVVETGPRAGTSPVLASLGQKRYPLILKRGSFFGHAALNDFSDVQDVEEQVERILENDPARSPDVMQPVPVSAYHSSL